MKWSYRLFRVSGIDVRVHGTFLLVVLLGGVYSSSHYGPSGFVFGAIAVCALFFCVILHELGHSLVAQRLGVDVREIVLLPIGGVAQLSREPHKPWHELVIALAGPLVNVVIAGLLYAAMRIPLATLVHPELAEPLLARPNAAALGYWLFGANVMLATFNMIPALPMDGGRVLRALLSMSLGKPRATRIAAGLGQIIAVGFMIFGFQYQPLLGLVGVFVFFAAAQERSFQQTALVLSELRAGEICDPHALTLAPGESLGGVLDQLLRSSQSAFAVLHGRELVGAVTRDDVIALAPRLGPTTPVAEIMRRELCVADASLPLDELRRLILEWRGPAVVMSEGAVVGVLSFEDLQRVAHAMQELSRRGLRRPSPAVVPQPEGPRA